MTIVKVKKIVKLQINSFIMCLILETQQHNAHNDELLFIERKVSLTIRLLLVESEYNKIFIATVVKSSNYQLDDL